jgi:two-component system response regulator YesN
VVGHLFSSVAPFRFAAVAHVFETLRISATIHCDVPGRQEWWPIHNETATLHKFEIEYGSDGERFAYNAECFAAMRRSHKRVRGELHGFSDLFVPVLANGEILATLVIGQFLTRRPSAGEIQSRWRRLTGRQGHLADSAFAAYLEMSLGALVLDDKLLPLFERLLDRIAGLIAGTGPLLETALETYDLRAEIEGARDAERMWVTLKTMVDERTPHYWNSVHQTYELAKIGLVVPPDHVLVGLAGIDARARDPVSAAVAMDALQRRAVALARRTGDVISGRVGEHGLAFVIGTKGSQRRRKQRALGVCERAANLARDEFGVALHFGVSHVPDGKPLWQSYRAALRAAEAALAAKNRTVLAESLSTTPTVSLHELRKELAKDLLTKPELLGVRFERYLDSVAVASGHRMDVAHVCLEAAFDAVADALMAHGALDARSRSELRARIERSSASATSAHELFVAYRDTMAAMSESVAHPVSARHQRGLLSALEYIQKNYAEPLRLSDVAKVAGFSTTYFCEIFKQRQGMTFREHLSSLRLGHARELLESTDLSASHVAELSGFRSLSYFSRAYRDAFGRSPRQWRAEPHRQRRTARYSAKRDLSKPG